jgi:hypothetical protein
MEQSIILSWQRGKCVRCLAGCWRASQQPCSRGASVRPEVLYYILLPSFYGFVLCAARSPIRGTSVVVIEGTRLLPNRFSIAHGAPS